MRKRMKKWEVAHNMERRRRRKRRGKRRGEERRTKRLPPLESRSQRGRLYNLLCSFVICFVLEIRILKFFDL